MNAVDLSSFELTPADREAIALAIPLVHRASWIYNTRSTRVYYENLAQELIVAVKSGTSLFSIPEFRLMVVALDLASSVLSKELPMQISSAELLSLGLRAPIYDELLPMFQDFFHQLFG